MIELLLSVLPLIQPLDHWLMEEQQVQEQTIYHSWYSSWDERQSMTQKAYELWWIDFVCMIECESWFNPKAKWDSWKSFWLCQMNKRRHDIPSQYYDDRNYQIEYCYNKWKWWTKFYWPQRIIKWMKCKDYVKERFIILWN